MSVAALSPTGSGASAYSTAVTAPPTLSNLSIGESNPLPSTLWLTSASLNATGRVTGGLAPYTIALIAGDGTTTTNLSFAGNYSIVHDFNGYWGAAVVSLVATDALGDVVTLGPFTVVIYATTLGIPQIEVAGDLVANVSYSVPVSLVAPMTGYAVVTTTNASLAWELGVGVDSNATVPGIFVWNTTNPYRIFDLPDGTTLYAQVFARNYYGVSWLPRGNGTLVATPEILTLSAISAVPGGRAPFTDNVSASVVGGTNDTIQSAIYSFPPNVIVTPSRQFVNGTTWLNASLTFPSPGTFIVVLHAVDIFFDAAIQTTTVFVAAGGSPALSGELVSQPAYIDAPLSFQATATGGSGQFQWNWSFGDGNFSSTADPLHSYALSGGYNVVLKVVDS
ncbi:MAG: PKD domain-containing protein, partial [Thermoplasmata archaeon]|nr:PKD domain-containing protein [Thermoplasmata archaeon]